MIKMTNSSILGLLFVNKSHRKKYNTDKNDKLNKVIILNRREKIAEKYFGHNSDNSWFNNNGRSNAGISSIQCAHWFRSSIHGYWVDISRFH